MLGEFRSPAQARTGAIRIGSERAELPHGVQFNPIVAPLDVYIDAVRRISSRRARRMSVIGLDHLQLAMPPGREAEARSFYAGVLGLSELVKPPNLAARGGVWFALGPIELHLGVEQEFRPARKAHPAFLVRDLAGLRKRLEQHGFAPYEDEPLAGYERFYAADPFGNRLEFLQPATR
jgi:catechol 2,3-dioxygenase-like lactoylglutathione lyase family enzyme